MTDKKLSPEGIIEATETLSANDFAALVRQSAYILDLKIVEQLEHDIASFEGGDSWIFDQYGICINEQLLPDSGDGHWTNKTLSMPGRKSTQNQTNTLKIGERYFAFYTYSAMAKGYSVEGLMSWNEEKLVRINLLINQ